MSELNAVAITVVSRNYFHFAAAMYESLRATNPGVPLIVYLLDEFPVDFQHPPTAQSLVRGDDPGFRIVPVKSIGIENWSRMSFQYTPFELACAVKPFATRHAVKNFAEKVIYSDADITFAGPLTDVTSRLDSCNVLLTPHLISVDNQAAATSSDRTNEETECEYALIAKAGVFNAGFYAVAKSQVTDDFLGWWCDRCKCMCYVSTTTGIFVDQSWLNFVPTLFDGVHVDRSPQLNVAYWNLKRRKLRQNSSNQWVVADNGVPVTCFHFSGFDLASPSDLTKYYHLVTYDVAPYRKLAQWYADSVLQFDPKAYSQLGCEFDSFEDGTTISPLWREAVRRGAPELDRFTDPWAHGVRESLLEQVRSLENFSIVSRIPWHLDALHSNVENLNRRIHKLARRTPKGILKRLGRALVPDFQRRAA